MSIELQLEDLTDEDLRPEFQPDKQLRRALDKKSRQQERDGFLSYPDEIFDQFWPLKEYEGSK